MPSMTMAKKNNATKKNGNSGLVAENMKMR